jgi:malate dehydrogenase (oxaloacetate-decarboxylating)(NADP+)
MISITKGNSTPLKGVDLLNNPYMNKGLAFTEEERKALELHGLLPPAILTIDQQAARVMENINALSSGLDKYITMMSLYDRNISLFYRVLIDHIEELMPVVYTPAVGEACLRYAHIYQRPRGIFISANEKGKIADVLKSWPFRDIRIIVVTDGERILGLGDLGANGMGIPVGKLSLYTACAGIDPASCLAVAIDVGTDNPDLLKDPLYIGLKQGRLRGPDYVELIDEFVTAVQDVFPLALLQFEDFATDNAVRSLKRYRNNVLMFNDDIQGTAAVTLAGLLSSIKITNIGLKDQRLLFLGAGEAGTGIGDLVVHSMMKEGLSLNDGLRRCWFMDSKGLVVKSRKDLAEHKLPFAHDHEPVDNLLEAVEKIRPTVLVGVSGQPSSFTKQVIEAMARINDRPVIFALSNPTSKSECTANEAYTWSGYRAIFASGSPFGIVRNGEKTLLPGQCNNVYIFPGVGLGVIAAKSRFVTDEMFLAAATTLANQVSREDLAMGRLYPSIKNIRDVSVAVALSVAEIAHENNSAQEIRPKDLVGSIKSKMYDP